jgi:hypothetical protein
MKELFNRSTHVVRGGSRSTVGGSISEERISIRADLSRLGLEHRQHVCMDVIDHICAPLCCYLESTGNGLWALFVVMFIQPFISRLAANTSCADSRECLDAGVRLSSRRGVAAGGADSKPPNPIRAHFILQLSQMANCTLDIFDSLMGVFETTRVSRAFPLVSSVESEDVEAGRRQHSCVVGRRLLFHTCHGMTDHDCGPFPARRTSGGVVELATDVEHDRRKSYLGWVSHRMN